MEASEMSELEDARGQIDRIDAELAALFEERMAAAARIAGYKKQNGLPVFDGAREEQVIAKGRDRISDERLKPYYEQLLRTVMQLSKAYQRTLFTEQPLEETAEGGQE